MKNSHRFLATAGVAVAVASYSLGAGVFAQDEPKRPLDPRQNPATGQINPGTARQAPSQSADAPGIPTPEEARAALLQPISRQPSAGDATTVTTGSGSQQAPAQSTASASGEPPPSGPITP